MKRLSNIFEKICTEDNFKLALYNAIKNKGHYKEVIKIMEDPDFYIHKYLEDVSSETYVTSPYKVFKLYSGHKWRTIYKLPMKDRIIQHAIMNIMEPWFRQHFIVDTYSSIKGRGIHRGLYRVKKALKNNHNLKYCLKFDIRKFYPSIDKEILKHMLVNDIKDKKLLSLLFKIIDSCESGVPIGNYTSQYFANYYLTDLDIYVKQELDCKYYFRYCDDIVILASSKESLHHIFNKIKSKVASLKLNIKYNYQIFPIELRGIDFLGYVIRRKYVRVRKKTKQAFVKSCNKHKDKSISSYFGILKHCDGRNLWKKSVVCDVPYITLKKYSSRKIRNKIIKITHIYSYIKSGKQTIKVSTDRGEFLSQSIHLINSLKGIKIPIEGIINKNYKFIDNESL